MDDIRLKWIKLNKFNLEVKYCQPNIFCSMKSVNIFLFNIFCQVMSVMIVTYYIKMCAISIVININFSSYIFQTIWKQWEKHAKNLFRN